MPRPGSSGRVPLGGDSLIVFRYSGEGFVPARIEARPLEDVSAITFLGERLVTEHPIVKEWNIGSPAAIAFDDTQSRAYRLTGGMGLESLYPVVQGYKSTAACRLPAQPVGSAAAQSRVHHGVVFAGW